MSRFNFISTPIKDLFIVEPKPIIDQRGFFERYFCAHDFEEIGLQKPVVQINHSVSTQAGIIRGFHYQAPPHAETKIVRCLKGRIFDVALDLRDNSPTFLQYFYTELSENNGRYLYIPDGFAHAFQALEDQSEILYLNTAFFAPECEGGINPLDKTLNIRWPIPPTNLSEKDLCSPSITSDFKGIKL